jgi:hypothetical protein
MDDEAIRAVVRRLARPHPSGGLVIERAVIVAEGSDAPAIIAWIGEHAGTPESTPHSSSQRGLHSPRLRDAPANGGPPRSYVLPPGALD